MESLSRLSRLPLAILISIVLNVVLCVMDFSIDPRQGTLSPIQHFVVTALTPAEGLMMAMTPGHSGAQIFALVVFSVVFYTVVAGVLLICVCGGASRG